jgi:WD40 repeat protein
MRRLSKLAIYGLFFLWNVVPGLLVAQSAPELVIQSTDSGSCEHAAFSHDGQLLATDNGDEVLLWEISTGKLLNTMKSYRSPEIKHMTTGATLMASARAKGTAVFSPDDKIVAVLPVDFANPLNFGPPGAPSSLWNVDTGIPLTTGQWNLDDRIARNGTAPSTPEVETWTISGNRAKVAELLDKGMKLQAISGDGSIGASRNEEPRNDQHIQLIDLNTGQVLRTIDASFNDILGMALSYDGRYFAAHSSNRRFVTVWDTSTGAELTEIKQDAQYPSVEHIAFSPNGKWFAVVWGGEIVLFETATWKRTSSFSREFHTIVEGELTFSPDSKELAIAGGNVSLIEVPTGKLIQTTCASPLHGITAVQWNEKSGVFALASDKFVRAWSPDAAARPATFTAQSTVHAMALSNDQRIAIGTRDERGDVKGNVYYEGTTKLWQLDAPDKETELGATSTSVLADGSSASLDFAGDGKAVAVAMLSDLDCPPKNHDARCDSDNRLVGLLTVWDATSGNLLRSRRQPDPELNVVAFSPDGSQIASGHQSKIVKIYDTANLNRMRAFKDPANETTPAISDYGTSALAYSPDGKRLLAGARDGLVWLLDAAGENPPRILRQVERFDPTTPNEESSGAIVAVLFSHDGKRAYAVESTGMVWKWSTSDWSDAGHYQIPAGVSAAALSPNSQVIASALADGTVRFYAAETGQLKLVLASTKDADSGLAISTDGKYDFGIPNDASLAVYRVGRKTVTLDTRPGNRHLPGLFAGFLKENSEMLAESTSRTLGQE